MSNFKFVLVIIAALILTSCVSKKKVSETYVKAVDSISYALPSEINFTITELCDSLNRPTQFVKTINTGVSTSTVQVKDNTLTVITKTDTIFKDRIKERIKTVKERVEVPFTPKWIKTLVWILATLVFVFIAFPKLPRALNVIFGKLLGFPI